MVLCSSVSRPSCCILLTFLGGGIGGQKREEEVEVHASRAVIDREKKFFSFLGDELCVKVRGRSHFLMGVSVVDR